VSLGRITTVIIIPETNILQQRYTLLYYLKYSILAICYQQGSNTMSNMSLKLILTSACLSCFMASPVLASAYYNSSPTMTTPSASGSQYQPPPAPNPVMSPDQFSSSVKAMHEQNKINLSQQVADELSQHPGPNASQTQTAGNNAVPNQGTPSQAQPTKPAASTASTSQPSTYGAPAATQNQPAQPSTYSGFGTGSAPAAPSNSGTAAPASSGKSNSGWTVQY